MLLSAASKIKSPQSMSYESTQKAINTEVTDSKIQLMPDLSAHNDPVIVGKAVSELEKCGISPERILFKPVRKHPALGEIVRQDPPPGTPIDSDQQIVLEVGVWAENKDRRFSFFEAEDALRAETSLDEFEQQDWESFKSCLVHIFAELDQKEALNHDKLLEYYALHRVISPLLETFRKSGSRHGVISKDDLVLPEDWLELYDDLRRFSMYPVDHKGMARLVGKYLHLDNQEIKIIRIGDKATLKINEERSDDLEMRVSWLDYLFRPLDMQIDYAWKSQENVSITDLPEPDDDTDQPPYFQFRRLVPWVIAIIVLVGIGITYLIREPVSKQTVITKISVSPTRLEFGEIKLTKHGGRLLGEPITKEIHIQNNGSADFTPIEVIRPDPPFDIISDFCGRSLAPGEQCTIGVRFSPSDLLQIDEKIPNRVREKEISRTLVIHTNDQNVKRILVGKVIYEPLVEVVKRPNTPRLPRISVDPARLDFGIVKMSHDGARLMETPATKTFSVKNHGSAKLVLFSVNPPVPLFEIVHTPNSCGSSLEPGKQCVIAVRFLLSDIFQIDGQTSNRERLNEFEYPLEIRTNDRNVRLLLAGKVVYEPEREVVERPSPPPAPRINIISPDKSRLDFGKVQVRKFGGKLELLGEPVKERITIQNTGDADLRITLTPLTPPFQIVYTSCEKVLHPYKQCFVDVGFLPSSLPKGHGPIHKLVGPSPPYKDKLRIYTNDEDVEIKLSGILEF